jgi:hypothetical protein
MARRMTPNCVGVDLSYTGTGIAWADDGVDVFTTDPKTDNVTRAERIALDVLAHTIDGDLVCIESGVYRSQQAFPLGILHGIVRHSLRMHRPASTVRLIPATTAKVYACGAGTADKIGMVVTARERLGYDGLNDNAADALWVRAIGMELLGHPVCELPKTHTRALDKLEALEVGA